MSVLPTREMPLSRGQTFQRTGQRRRSRLPRSQQALRNRPTRARLDGYIEVFSNYRRRLADIVVVYRNQLSIYPLQVEATLTHLLELRRVAGAARTYLDQLEPSDTERLRPYGCIAKLACLDWGLSELLLTVAMFAEVCQVVSPERVAVHMTIRTALPALLATYDDLLAQLSALTDSAREETYEKESQTNDVR